MDASTLIALVVGLAAGASIVLAADAVRARRTRTTAHRDGGEPSAKGADAAHDAVKSAESLLPAPPAIPPSPPPLAPLPPPVVDDVFTLAASIEAYCRKT